MRITNQRTNNTLYNNKSLTFGTTFSKSLQRELAKAADLSLLTKQHLEYINNLKKDGLPTKLYLGYHYTPGEQEVIITSPSIEKLRAAKNIEPRGEMIWNYSRSTTQYSLNYKALADLFSPSSNLNDRIRWAEEDAVKDLKEMSQKVKEQITSKDIKNLFS